MSADQLIAELKALSAVERQQVISAVLSDQVVWLPKAVATAGDADFVDQWTGRFSLPERDPNDARLAFLLDRFYPENQ